MEDRDALKGCRQGSMGHSGGNMRVRMIIEIGTVSTHGFDEWEEGLY